MTTWARIIGGNTAVDVVTQNPSTLFALPVADQFVVVPDGTEDGATLADGVWTNPAPITPPSLTIVYPTMAPMIFYVAFTPTERMMIKALASAAGIPANSPLLGGTNSAIPQDALITEFWSSFELALSVDMMIDPNLVSIQEGLAYMGAPTSPTPIILAAGRAAQISQGIPQ